MRTRLSFTLVSLGLMASLLSACSTAPTSAPSSSTSSSVNTRASLDAVPIPAEAMPISSRYRIGLLLPTSGGQAQLGQNLLYAAQLANYDQGGDSFDLLPRDTGGTPAGAAAAAQGLIADGAHLIIGPVFSAEVESVQPLTAAVQVPLLALSNNAGLANRKTYVFGYTPAEQVQRVIAYAQSQGIRRVAVFAPSSAYGESVAMALSDTAARYGLMVIANDRYAASGDLAAQASAFMTKLNAQGGAQALLLPDTGAVLQGVLAGLTAAGFDGRSTRLLGLSNWDDAQVQVLPQLVGAWYPAVDKVAKQAFNNRYQQTYGAAPSPLAAITYDAVALAAIIAKSSSSYDLVQLTDAQGFQGVSGAFRLKENGQVEHSLAIYEVQQGEPSLVREAAPQRFSLMTN